MARSLLQNGNFNGSREYWGILHHDDGNPGHNEAIYPYPPPAEGYYYAIAPKSSDYSISLYQDVNTPHEAGNEFEFSIMFRARGENKNIEFVIWELEANNKASSGTLHSSR